jgi:hypothetical protein
VCPTIEPHKKGVLWKLPENVIMPVGVLHEYLDVNLAADIVKSNSEIHQLRPLGLRTRARDQGLDACSRINRENAWESSGGVSKIKVEPASANLRPENA